MMVRFSFPRHGFQQVKPFTVKIQRAKDIGTLVGLAVTAAIYRYNVPYTNVRFNLER